MSLFNQAQSLVTESAPVNAQVIRKTFCRPDRFAELAAAIEAAHPTMALNENAISKGGVTASGKPTVPFACKMTLPTKASCTVYHNGTVVWTGIDPIEL